ncbi:hypothetical protein C8F04DRAFT_1248976 [Mycena alexandri]|uniref:DUF1168-domain-containing protein n=1 Tax=Mycena alexandri TaxID=1745969 RepID=A0AAD6TFD6_9AGAR|nr:hypothetical protein C8F04DRAFT_1248976 [Mycena alexandri]
MSNSNVEASVSTGAANRHVLTAVERQRSQLDRLLKDPVKPAFVPPPPKEKTIRPAREMMKNVQGSSAGAGSGEFHVYKASRRREYERLKILEETSQKEADEAAFERKRREAEEQAESKTAKNRAKRQKKKERSKTKGSTPEGQGDGGARDAPIKKRRLVNGQELVFRKPGEESDSEDEAVGPQAPTVVDTAELEIPADMPPILDTPRITIHEDD